MSLLTPDLYYSSLFEVDLDDLARRGGVGNHGIHHLKAAQRKHRMASQFGVVQAKNDFLRSADHRVLDVDQKAVGVGDALR